MTTTDKTIDKYAGNTPVAFTPHVYEVHGNSFYMHCSDEEQEHSKKFYPCPKLGSVVDKTNHVPLCPDCEKPMKPHSMFFDESYSEHYYRKETVDKMVEAADCLIVIGTALATSYAARIVGNFLAVEKPVIEINIEPCVQVGHTYHVIGKSEEVLPKMFASYHQKIKPTAPPLAKANSQKAASKP